MILNRLVISGNKRTVFDEQFHSGINILRGDNGSGKTTISEMIFYVLGGENIDWTDEAKSCDYVYAEFMFSGATLSLRREISINPLPISVAEGPLTENIKDITKWSNYGRTRSEKKESFSQFIFEYLGFPPTKSDDSNSNVTMYQVLRLLYGDQNTDSTSLFRTERNPFADRPDLRRSVGEMLLGIDDFQSHELRQELAKISKLYSQKKSRLDSLSEAAMKADPNFGIAQYSNMIENTKKEQAILETKVDEIGRAESKKLDVSSADKDVIKKLQTKVDNENQEIANLSEKIQSLKLNIEDSLVFVSSLKSDLSALSLANKTRDLIGKVTLMYCPICLENLNEREEDHCPLCNTRSDSNSLGGGRIRYSQELKHQISESERLLDSRAELLLTSQHSLKELIRSRNKNLTDLRSYIKPTARVNSQVSRLLKKHGYLDRLIEDLGRLEGLQDEVKSLQTEVIELKIRVGDIEHIIKLRHEKQEARRIKCHKRIGELTIEILHEDIVDKSNNTLNNAKGLVTSFEKDFLSVRQGRLSASTQAFLKNSFYLGFLKFAIEDVDCRLPNFLILDNIEDKGMVPDRFRRFHHLLVDYSDSIDIPHQVILTTSYIDDDLNDSGHCIGPSYNAQPYTLDLKGES